MQIHNITQKIISIFLRTARRKFEYFHHQNAQMTQKKPSDKEGIGTWSTNKYTPSSLTSNSILYLFHNQT